MTKIDVDNHKLMYHPERVAEWKARGDCFPIYVEIGTTNRCNHRCIYCALDQWVGKNVRDIDSEVMLSNIKDMALHGVKSVMLAGEGESVLHKDIGLFVKTAKEYGIDISITTNGGQYTPEKINSTLPYLSWLRFSLDAGTAKTYSEVHRVKEEEFERVLSHIRYVVNLKHKNNYHVVIGIQTLILSKNIDELPRLAEIAKEIGVDNIQLKPYSKHPLSINDLTADYSKMGTLERQVGALQDENFQVMLRAKTIERLFSKRDYNICYGLSFMALIDAKGNVMPCNLFYDSPEFTYGNINDDKFSEIWQSKQRRKVMEKLECKGIDECRKGCRLDPINRYLHRLKVNPHPHDNFI